MDDKKAVAQRGNPNIPRYTDEEIQAIRRLWPRGTVEEIQAALPNRKMSNLRFQAQKLGVQCEVYRGGGLRFETARAAGRPIKRADEYKRPRPAPEPEKAQRKEDQSILVSVTAEEIRRLPATHPGRLAYTQAARHGGIAAQEAYRQWQQSQVA